MKMLKSAQKGTVLVTASGDSVMATEHFERRQLATGELSPTTRVFDLASGQLVVVDTSTDYARWRDPTHPELARLDRALRAC